LSKAHHTTCIVDVTRFFVSLRERGKFLKIRVLLLPGAMDTWPSIQMQILALIILILAIWTFVW
jgi:hypothetical protein